MYKCQICQRVTPPGTKSYRIAVEFRFRKYPAKEGANLIREHRAMRRKDDPGGQGYEIAREVIACPDCAAQLKSQQKHQTP